MQAVGIQFNYMQGMFYTNVYFKRNPQYKKQAGALWQFELDTTLAMAPGWVPDYKTKGEDVFVQDKNDELYLIGSNGHKLWQKSISEPIMGTGHALDAMKNGKSQVIFNTRKEIYAIDRTGKNLYGYPLDIPSKATAPIALFDYENNRNYRILVPCGDDKIRAYDAGGRSIKDWKAPQTEANVKCPLQYVKVNGKDFIIAVDIKGNVYAYDRKGKSRMDFKHKLPENIAHFNIVPGKEESETYIFAADSMGMVYQLSLTDFLTRTQYLKDNIRGIDFAPVDLEGNGKIDMIFLTEYDIYAFELDKNPLFHFTVKNSLKHNLLTFTGADGKARIGAIDAEKNKLYMWDSQGTMCNGFPLYGSTLYSIGDMNNDGQLYLVTGSNGNNVYVYSLP
jgi:hypothetical protein